MYYSALFFVGIFINCIRMLLNNFFNCDIVKNCKDNGIGWRVVGLTIVGLSGFSAFAVKWKKKQHLKKLALDAKNAETFSIIQKLDELLKDKDVCILLISKGFH